jgi:hypothetical protein
MIRPQRSGGTLFSVEGPGYRPQRQPSQGGWKDLFQHLTRIDRSNLAKVALELVDESGKPREDSDTASLAALEIDWWPTRA